MLMDATYIGLDSFDYLGDDKDVIVDKIEGKADVQLLSSTSCSHHQNLNNYMSNMLMTYLALLHLLGDSDP